MARWNPVQRKLLGKLDETPKGRIESYCARSRSGTTCEFESVIMNPMGLLRNISVLTSFGSLDLLNIASVMPTQYREFLGIREP